MNPITIAALVAVAIVLVVVGSNTLVDLFKERAKLVREQRSREDYAASQDRARSYYERDIGYIADVFDPLSLFHS